MSTKEKMKEEKSEMYRKLKNKRNSEGSGIFYICPRESDEDYEPEEEPKRKKKKRRKGKKRKEKKKKKENISLQIS